MSPRLIHVTSSFQTHTQYFIVWNAKAPDPQMLDIKVFPGRARGRTLKGQEETKEVMVALEQYIVRNPDLMTI